MLDTVSSESRFTREIEPSLPMYLAFCLARAKELGKPVIARWHLALSKGDPFSLLPHLADEPYMAWHDGRSSLRFVAGKALVECQPKDFAETQTFCATLLEQVVDIGEKPADLPLLVGGFDFYFGSSQPTWQSWPAGLLFLPQWLMYSQEQTRGLIICQHVTPTSDIKQIEQHLWQHKERLHVLSTRKVANKTSSTHTFVAEPLETKEHFEARVQKAKESIQAKILEKVVLARATDFIAQKDFDVAAILEVLHKSQKASTCFAIKRSETECFLGATPETLVEVSGRNLQTHALAGSAPRGANEEEDHVLGKQLIDSHKNRDEHGIVAKALELLLTPYCAELNHRQIPQLVRLTRIQHLETRFSATLRQAGRILDLLQCLHPTPSVGGWPKQQALNFLREHESTERGFYAAPVGWLTAAGDGVFAVAIRSVLLNKNRARAFAGVGIVADSDPTSEWHETELKLQTVRDALRVQNND